MTFQAAVCTLALHHFPRPGRVFREIARVLDRSPGAARLVIFTADPEQMRRYWLTQYFPDAMQQAIQQMPPIEPTLALLDASGFRQVDRVPWSITPELQDLFLYAGKYGPELYLDPRVRAGISTFANQADPAEVERGCARLSADLASGRSRTCCVPPSTRTATTCSSSPAAEPSPQRTAWRSREHRHEQRRLVQLQLDDDNSPSRTMTSTRA